MMFKMKRAIQRATQRTLPDTPFWKDAKHCYWCGIKLLSNKKFRFDPRYRTKEHLLPKSQGGRGLGNITAACRRCNTTRGCDPCWIPFSRQSPHQRHRGVQQVERLDNGLVGESEP